MAVKRKPGEERRPAPNTDEETRHSADEVAEGVDKETAKQVARATTTRKRTTVSKRAHEPLDPKDADDDQPDEDANGPRAAEVGKSK